MTQSLRVSSLYVSNHIEKLAYRLGRKLLSYPPLTPQWILLPKKALQSLYLKEMQSQIPNLCLMRVRFEELDSGISQILEYLGSPPLFLPSINLLQLQIEVMYANSKEKEKERELARELSSLFLTYPKGETNAFLAWLSQDHWQQRLFKELFACWDSPHLLATRKLPSEKKQGAVHLFNFPFVPPLYHHFFRRLQSCLDVVYYQFSPCCSFWEDMVSEKKRFAIHWHHAKQGVKPALSSELDRYLKDRNVLLANWGKPFQRTLSLFDRSQVLEEEDYSSPDRETLLGKIQSSILRGEDLEMGACQWDDSLVLSQASSRLREVEILWKNVLGLLAEKNLFPEEIQILAPDISLYAPLLDFVCKREKTTFSVLLMNFQKPPFLHAMETLLCLREERFSLESIRSFLTDPLVYKNLDLKLEEVSDFCEVMERVGVRWGWNREHRASLLGKESVEKGEDGTWDLGFSLYLRELAQASPVTLPWRGIAPKLSDAESFGKCFAFLKQLTLDLEILETEKRSLVEWKSFLLEVLQRVFGKEKGNVEGIDLFKITVDQLDLLEEKLEKNQIPSSLPGSSLKKWLLDTLQGNWKHSGEVDFRALFCRSLQSGVVFPAKVTFILGLEEGAFPRTSGSSLDAFALSFPSSIEEDRALFLETLLSTRQALYLSYVSMDLENGTSIPPCSLVQELFSYLDAKGTIENGLPSTMLLADNPPFPFHSHCFSKDRRLLSFSSRDFQTASKLYSTEPMQSLPFFSSFSQREFEKMTFPLPSNHISLKDLLAFSRHPIRFYCRRICQIFLSYSPLKRDLSLSPLSKWLLKSFSPKVSYTTIIEQLEKWGKLPIGRFKDLAKKELFKQWEKEQSEQKGMLTFQKTCKQPTQVGEQEWILPSFSVTVDQNIALNIEGSLHGISENGLFLPGKKTKQKWIEYWPSILLFFSLPEDLLETLSISRQITWHTSSFSLPDALEPLQRFLFYYLLSQTNPSPFLPKWIDCFLQEDVFALSKTIQSDLSLGNDPYLDWIFHDSSSFSSSLLLEKWTPIFRDVYYGPSQLWKEDAPF